MFYRREEQRGGGGGGGTGSEGQLQLKIQAFVEKMATEKLEKEVEEKSPASLRRYSLSHVVVDERRELRFNRSEKQTGNRSCF